MQAQAREKMNNLLGLH